MRIFWFVLGILVPLGELYANYPIRCNVQQDKCQVNTTRLTIGDYVGVFSERNLLVAIGRVESIRDQARLLKMSKKWGPILRSHFARRIDDEAARSPKKFFRIQEPLAKQTLGASANLFTLGLGDGLSGLQVDGEYKKFWKEQLFWSAKLGFIDGSGTAVDTLVSPKGEALSLRAYTLSGGIYRVFAPYAPVAFQLGVDLGFASVSTSIAGDLDYDRAVNGRLSAGNQLYTQFAADGLWRRQGVQPQAGVRLWRLGSATSFALSLGVSYQLYE